jgi:hypothetical protein
MYMRLWAYFECIAVCIYGSEQKLGGATITFHVKYFFAVSHTVFEGTNLISLKSI